MKLCVRGGYRFRAIGLELGSGDWAGIRVNHRTRLYQLVCGVACDGAIWTSLIESVPSCLPTTSSEESCKGVVTRGYRFRL